jgi:hypothetical protein
LNIGKHILKHFIAPLGGNSLALLFGRRSLKGIQHLYQGKDARQTFHLLNSLYLAGNLFLIRVCMKDEGEQITTIDLRKVTGFLNYDITDLF